MSVHRSTNRYFWGFILVAVGALLLLDNLGILDFGDFIARFWPVILVIIGLRLIIVRKSRDRISGGDVDSTDDSDRVRFSHTFGDVRLKLKSQQFAGGEVSNVFGNIEVDLEEVKIQEGSHELLLKGVFGDLIVFLPKDIPLSVRATTSIGSTRVKDRSSSGISGRLDYITKDFNDSENKLSITAHQVFGDLRVF